MEEIVYKAEPKHHFVLKVILSILGIVVVGAVLLFIYKGNDVPQAVTTSMMLSDPMQESSGSEELINGIPVPPEPDPVINNATLAGVDSNSNGVRDDVERVIAREFGTSPVQYAQAMKWSAAEQNMLVLGSQEAIDHYIKLAQCDDLDADDVDPLSFKLMNTEARQIRYRTVLAGLVTGELKCSE